ncbi:hypothetical protein [Peristeroidobacter soli]|uniref:hypothetical protein n=1 Tax=Peristeroidobacter soli TaxID=2497877 RepID=UPI00101DD027|nr:hypothetical protein [Peristeroidobacter soli]
MLFLFVLVITVFWLDRDQVVGLRDLRRLITSLTCFVPEETCSACLEQAAVKSRTAALNSTVEVFTTFISASLGGRKYGRVPCSANANVAIR